MLLELYTQLGFLNGFLEVYIYRTWGVRVTRTASDEAPGCLQSKTVSETPDLRGTYGTREPSVMIPEDVFCPKYVGNWNPLCSSRGLDDRFTNREKYCRTGEQSFLQGRLFHWSLLSMYHSGRIRDIDRGTKRLLCKWRKGWIRAIS